MNSDGCNRYDNEYKLAESSKVPQSRQKRTQRCWVLFKVWCSKEQEQHGGLAEAGIDAGYDQAQVELEGVHDRDRQNL